MVDPLEIVNYRRSLLQSWQAPMEMNRVRVSSCQLFHQLLCVVAGTRDSQRDSESDAEGENQVSREEVVGAFFINEL